MKNRFYCQCALLFFLCWGGISFTTQKPSTKDGGTESLSEYCLWMYALQTDSTINHLIENKNRDFYFLAQKIKNAKNNIKKSFSDENNDHSIPLKLISDTSNFLTKHKAVCRFENSNPNELDTILFIVSVNEKVNKIISINGEVTILYKRVGKPETTSKKTLLLQ